MDCNTWITWAGRLHGERRMRIVAVEEHFVYADLLARIHSKTLEQNGSHANADEILGLETIGQSL